MRVVCSGTSLGPSRTAPTRNYREKGHASGWPSLCVALSTELAAVAGAAREDTDLLREDLGVREARR
jgi:hypothetical protein